MKSKEFERLKEEIKRHGYLKNKKMETAFERADRKNFVPEKFKEHCYENIPLPIMKNQTISQPLTVVAMTEALDVKKGQKILEIGTGSGYQAALLSELVGGKGKIVTIERLESLYEYAKNHLKNRNNVTVILGDGSLGYSKEAPYHRIMVTAEAPDVPLALIKQLTEHGKIIIPVKNEMWAVYKNGKMEFIGNFAFVPLIGKQGYRL